MGQRAGSRLFGGLAAGTADQATPRNRGQYTRGTLTASTDLNKNVDNESSTVEDMLPSSHPARWLDQHVPRFRWSPRAVRQFISTSRKTMTGKNREEILDFLETTKIRTGSS